ncbi:DUF3388 domain-containing protein [Domibacillus enclensis]|uniref:ACT domain-containing protein n=1 Tax=Domibacillus enclensis TaxID=1017273 RepID=A0A1N6USK5_9BACI|nr:DUF3388 domain-containing protein [Domibacillus enclensis]OXS78611.1 hypothetical protein B1B05_08410 [Domibacillus enclensis]SIQ68559.1 Protein of unknown function [Domibacillus enclensis]
MVKKEYYLEYKIKKNRPGLLGDISSLLGMLSINIVTINGVDDKSRGLLMRAETEDQIKRLESILRTIDTIDVVKLREPKLRDKMAVRHGRYIERDEDDRKTFRFVRSELGLLVDFMAELYKMDGHRLIGIRGMPRVGKTESIVAASVCANKKWLFMSSTMIKQTVREQLLRDEYSPKNIFILDGVISTNRAGEKHWQLIREVMQLPAVKVVEHPDVFVENSHYSINDFDYIIELRNEHDEEITYEGVEKNNLFQDSEFGGFNF